MWNENIFQKLKGKNKVKVFAPKKLNVFFDCQNHSIFWRYLQLDFGCATFVSFFWCHFSGNALRRDVIVLMAFRKINSEISILDILEVGIGESLGSICSTNKSILELKSWSTETGLNGPHYVFGVSNIAALYMSATKPSNFLGARLHVNKEQTFFFPWSCSSSDLTSLEKWLSVLSVLFEILPLHSHYFCFNITKSKFSILLWFLKFG